MRYIGILLIILSLPTLIWWVRAYPRQRKWAYFAIGILPFTMGWMNLDVAFLNWDSWPGFARGLIVSILDTLAIAVIMVARAPFRRLPLLGVLTVYMAATAISILFSELWVSSFFYTFQLLRVILVFVAVASVAGQGFALRWIARGLAAGAIFQGIATIDQRLSGVVQASGTMVHQNLLGMMLHFVTLPLLALLLAGEQSKVIKIGLLASITAVALGASRGAVSFGALGIALTVFLSLIRHSTPHKWKIAGAGIVIITFAVPLAASTFSERFANTTSTSDSDNERLAFERAAKAMWKDHPMGVGANQYVVIANSQNYSQNAGVIWNFGSRSAHVHNIYLLAAAETGWIGLISLILLFFWTVARGLVFAFTHRKDPRGDVVLGASIAVLMAAIHGMWEWIFVIYNTQYVFAISLGIIAGCIRQAKLDKQASDYARNKRSSKPGEALNRSNGRQTSVGGR